MPNKLDTLGVANPTQPVEVWKDSDSPSTVSRSGEYFHHALTVAYSSYPEVRAKSLFVPNKQVSAGRSFVPPAIEDFDHDLDGNLIKDGRWTAYVWDGENRLIEMKRDNATSTEARQRLTFEYDHLGRRVRKRFFTPSGTNWAEQRETIYLYDGWNLVAELDGNNANATLRTYVWGTELSGNRSGAGGVGGLLWVNNSQTTGGLPTGIQFVAYDGNGNISGLVSATDGSNTARYEYGPFGEPLRTAGPMAAANPIRWSTKVTDDETGVVYYGFRYYSPGTGRWLSRDPVEERGSSNLYGFIVKDPTGDVDCLGNLSLKNIAFSQLNGCVSFARTFPVGAIGPVPGFATVGVQGKMFEYSKNGQMQCWGEVKSFVELYGRIGVGYDDRERVYKPKGRDRNERIPDPYKPGGSTKRKDLEGKLVDPSGKFRDRQSMLELVTSKSCACPKEGLSGSLKVFLRGSAGIRFVGAQFNAEKALFSTDDIGGADFSAGVAFGVTGASVEAGGGGELQYTGPLPFPCRN